MMAGKGTEKKGEGPRMGLVFDGGANLYVV